MSMHTSTVQCPRSLSEAHRVLRHLVKVCHISLDDYGPERNMHLAAT